MTDLNQLSEQILLAVKLQEPTNHVEGQLANLNEFSLLQMDTDGQKNAFWINIYNAFYQILAKQQPQLGKQIYGLKAICIANRCFSLDDIEHGILRLGKYKYSLGFWNHPFKYQLYKVWQPSLFDYRIHFALNCGAKSCPPIVFYNPDGLNAQLDSSTEGFLVSETEIKHQTKTIYLSRLFLWFYNDFGGKKGIYRIINRHLNQSVNGYKVQYNTYDWTPTLGDFK